MKGLFLCFEANFLVMVQYANFKSIIVFLLNSIVSKDLDLLIFQEFYSNVANNNVLITYIDKAMVSHHHYRPRFIFFLSLFGYCLLNSATAQTQQPFIQNLDAYKKADSAVLIVNYDLVDDDSQEVGITLKASADNGRTFFESSEGKSGDIGFPVSPGSDRKIRWEYPDSINDIGIYRIKLIADDRDQVNIQNVVDQVDSNRLKNLVETIEGNRHKDDGLSHLNAIKDTIEDRFRGYDLFTSRHQFTYQGYQGHNILGKLHGTNNGEATFVVDAHFDGVENSPGADDNASGMAGVLEAARILSQYNFESSVKFISFDQEEEGIVGSQRYVRSGIRDYENIEGVFNFEMIGYYSEEPNTQEFPNGFGFAYPEIYNEVRQDSFRGDFITNVANKSSSSLKQSYDSAAENYVPDLDVISLEVPGNGDQQGYRDFRRSDHSSFWDSGYQALMITNTSEFRNDNYHTPGDSMETLNFRFMSNVVKATVGAICEEAGIQHGTSSTATVRTPTTSIASEEECQLQVSPIPASNIIYISPGSCFTGKESLVVHIIASSGRKVLEKTIDVGQKGERIPLNIDHLNEGLFLIGLQSETQYITKKVIVK